MGGDVAQQRADDVHLFEYAVRRSANGLVLTRCETVVAAAARCEQFVHSSTTSSTLSKLASTAGLSRSERLVGLLDLAP